MWFSSSRNCRVWQHEKATEKWFLNLPFLFQITDTLMDNDSTHFRSSNLTINLDGNRIREVIFYAHTWDMEKCSLGHDSNKPCHLVRLYLPNNTIECNTSNFEFMKFLQSSEDSRLEIVNGKELRCSPWSERGSNQPISNVNLWDFHTEGAMECPPTCACKTHMIDQAIQISNCTTLPSSLPPNTRELQLSGDVGQHIPNISKLLTTSDGIENLTLGLANANLEDISVLDLRSSVRVRKLHPNVCGAYSTQNFKLRWL